MSLFVILAVSLVVAWGCTQTDDIVSGITTTYVYLQVERLPSAPTGMVYQLWVANQSDTVTLGQFGWDNVMKEILLPSGANRADSNKFELSDDLMSYSHLLVSVELTGAVPTSPGPIMLMDEITDPENDQMELVFPLSDSLWLATVRFNMQPTSGNSRAGDGTAVWFANYRAVSDTTPDTTALSWTFTSETRALLVVDTQEGGQVDSLFISPDQTDTLSAAEVFVKVPWTIEDVTVDSMLKTYGPDTLNLGYNIAFGYHTFVSYREDSIIDSTPPYERHRFNFTWTISSESMPLDIFSQDEFGLPNLDDYGWKYRGWIISTKLDTAVVPTRFTELAWPVENLPSGGIIGASFSGMFTTGTFSDIQAADDANPFVLSGGQVPPFPGEDFLDPTALQAEYGIGGPIDLRSSLFTDDVSTVFISLEPTNAPSDTTNFPLVPFLGMVPFFPDMLDSTEVGLDMWNWTQSVNGNNIGFPKIRISIERL
jgi:hypothetical protein